MNITDDSMMEFDFKEENIKIWMATFYTLEARNRVAELGSPSEIRQRNLRIVLEWLYRWGFSTGNILSDLLGRANRTHARRLEKEGWIRSVSVKGYPTYFVLTERGLTDAIRHSTALLEYKEIDPYRVHLPNLHHDLIAQSETLAELNKGWFNDYLTQRMYNFTGDHALKKIPDVILIRQFRNEEKQIVKHLVGIEIELTPKWNYKLDLFVTDVLDDIQFQRIDGYIIVSDSRAILERYSKAFRPSNKVKIWKCSGKGKIINTGEIYTVLGWVPRFVMFRHLGSTEPYGAANEKANAHAQSGR